MKKFVSICLSLSLLISTTLICNISAYSYDISSFEIYQYSEDETFITQYNGDDTELVIDDNMFKNADGSVEYIITGISYGAFSGNTTLEKITIKGSVKQIEGRAFAGCTNLKEVIIGDNVTELGLEAFMGCDNLATVTLSNSITEIKTNTFKNCTNLIDITSPANLEIIGDSAFENCSSLKYCIIPNGVTKIGSRVFYGCTSFLKTIIPQTVEQLGTAIFYGCESMERVSLPDNLKTIPSSMFENCKSLKEITLPDSLTKIDGFAFSNCKGIYAVYVSDLSHWLNISFSGNEANPLYSASQCNLYIDGVVLKDLVIPDGVTSINNYQFDRCKSIETVNFGKDVKTIGIEAFANCPNLKEVVLPENIEKLDFMSFYSTGTLETVTIENPDCEIGNTVFYKTTLKAPHLSTAHTYANEHNSLIDFAATDEHVWRFADESSKEPTCTENGEHVNRCELCGVLASEELPTTGHKYAESIIKPACTEQGYITYTCAYCKDTYTTYTDALGHNFDNSEKYCLNGCNEENPNYKEESVLPTEPTTEPKTTTAVAVTSTTTKVSETTSKKYNDNYTGSRDTAYADYRIIPGYGQIKVAWTADSKIDGYEIYISTDNNNFKKTADVKAKNSDYYIIDNLTLGQVYYIKLKGYLYHNGKKIEMNSFSNTQSLTVK